MQGVNLIPAPRRAAQQRKRRLRAWIILATVYGGLVLAACGTIRVMGDHGTATAAELSDYQRHIQQLDLKLTDLQKQLAEVESSRRTTAAISDQPDWSVLFPILGTTVGDNVVLREIQLKPETDSRQNKGSQARQPAFNLQLRGFAKSQPGVAQFVLRLQQLNLFDEVKLQRTGREPLSSAQVVTFEIFCTLREGANAGSKP